MRYVLAIAAPLALAGLALMLRLPQRFGAHPWWSDTVILVGLPIGLAIAFLLGWLNVSKWWSTGIATGLAVVAMATASFGKVRFAASYAEDQFAGQMWYFGWIGVCTTIAAFLALSLWPPRTNS